MEILIAIISSTFISTLITTFWNVIDKNKDNSLKYITEERKQWREDFRKIIVELNDCKGNNIKHITAKIKCRINTYGISNPDDFLKDAHIWKIIFDLENSNKEDFENNKNLLLNCLCALLKFDWERAKNETTIFPKKIIQKSKSKSKKLETQYEQLVKSIIENNKSN